MPSPSCETFEDNSNSSCDDDDAWRYTHKQKSSSSAGSALLALALAASHEEELKHSGERGEKAVYTEVTEDLEDEAVNENENDDENEDEDDDGYNEDLPSSPLKQDPVVEKVVAKKREGGIQFTAFYPTPAPSSSPRAVSASASTSSIHNTKFIEEGEEFSSMSGSSPSTFAPSSSSSPSLSCSSSSSFSFNSSRPPFQVISPLDSIQRLSIPKTGRPVTIGRSTRTADIALSFPPTYNYCLNHSHNANANSNANCELNNNTKVKNQVSRVHVSVSYHEETKFLFIKCVGWNGCIVNVPSYKRVRTIEGTTTFTSINTNPIIGPTNSASTISKAGGDIPDADSFKELKRARVSNGVTEVHLKKNQVLEVKYVRGITVAVKGAIVGLVEVDGFQSESDLEEGEGDADVDEGEGEGAESEAETLYEQSTSAFESILEAAIKKKKAIPVVEKNKKTTTKKMTKKRSGSRIVGPTLRPILEEVNQTRLNQPQPLPSLEKLLGPNIPLQQQQQQHPHQDGGPPRFPQLNRKRSSSLAGFEAEEAET